MTALSIATANEATTFSVVNQDIIEGEQSVHFDLKHVVVTLPDTADGGDTTVIVLEDYGIKRLLGIKGYVHTTTNSVITMENPTTVIQNGNLTISVPVGTMNDKRVYELFGV